MNKAKRLERIFRASKAHMGPEVWKYLLNLSGSISGPEELPSVLHRHAADLGLPGYLPELARLEWAVFEAGSSAGRHGRLPGSRRAAGQAVHADSTESGCSDLAECAHEYQLPESGIAVNPTLYLLRCSWKHLPDLLDSRDLCPAEYPEKGEEFVLFWRHPANGELIVCSAFDEDLLALKIAVEEIPPAKAAAEGNVPVYVIEAAIERAVRKGLLLAPASKIRRDRSAFSGHAEIDESDLSASVFTLQWHITQACDLHCRHCYDRSDKKPVELKQAMALLDNFHVFCEDNNVRGQISFTGGNPFLHPDFPTLYRAAAERGFSAAILGNPVPGEQLEELVAIRYPAFFQVSLEGLPEQNDWIRGPGHFDGSMAFLDLLRELGVYSMVMLTLTKHNIAQVLPLAEMLKDKADLFTFNRLSLMGEGASLQLPPKDEYIDFLHRYNDAALDNPGISLKDNLINIVRYRKGLDLFGGCSGYGCGAAFNFIAVLPDGEVHACRKFHSPIGNVVLSTIAEVYRSEAAVSYRAGCRACRPCEIRHACGGCLAVSYSLGLDPLRERDPYCFIA